nr:hypothetical protein pmam_332 [Pithovirus mammoth]
MSFPLVDAIYDNIHLLSESKIISSDSDPKTTTIDYLNFRIGKIGEFKNILHRLQNSPVGDQKWGAYKMLLWLSYVVHTNPHDGVYWTVISDCNTKFDKEEVVCHHFLIEKSGEKYCLIQSDPMSKGKAKCAVVRGIDKIQIVKKLLGLTKLFEKEPYLDWDDWQDWLHRLVVPPCLENPAQPNMTEWLPEEWVCWIQCLGLPEIAAPKNLQIFNPRAVWGFVRLSSKGILHNFKKAVENRIPPPVLNFDRHSFSLLGFKEQEEMKKQLHKYAGLMDLLSEIEDTSQETDYLKDDSKSLDKCAEEFDLMIKNFPIETFE